ncbi:hypothetical protein GCM10025865_22560 [Paraoerskovia sediminicola]|uniref:Uncharacterized protein n=1 Tax=Paraoerskovia sediminicola TaxID=1138587 RepID=A0ABN6XDK1_9CELL|nr:hypothetical protein GCM10025865_22560 [Paraoerskovia sediminicola]
MTGGVASTIVDATGDVLTVVREGALTLAELNEVVDGQIRGPGGDAG